ncbi:MAG: DUF1905 domain-containing protein [Bacteroidales bacterium]|nr:DUF1905 domain-containing protein [Bacteroidales bacterium]
MAEVPPEVMDQLGRNRHVPVRGLVDGYGFKSSCALRKEGRYVVILKGDIRKKIGKSIGDPVVLELEHDPESREIPLPEDMELILAEDEEVLQEFLKASPSNRREYTRYVVQAKHEDTRLKRINLLVVRMKERISKRKKRKEIP